MFDEPEDPEEPSSGSTGLPPPGQAPSDVDSDMEEAFVSSADDSMPGLISESLTPKTSSTTKSRHWRVIVDHLDRCPLFELDDEMLLMFFQHRQPRILLQNRPPRIPDHIEGVEVYATPCRVVSFLFKSFIWL
jgi:hypothetical protein